MRMSRLLDRLLKNPDKNNINNKTLNYGEVASGTQEGSFLVHIGECHLWTSR